MFKRPFIVLLSLVLSGCANLSLSNMFNTYSDQYQQTRIALNSNNLEAAQLSINLNTPSDTNYQLDLVEKGKIAQLAQNYKQSLEYFNLAIEKQKNEQLKAQIQISKTGEQIGALLSNDNALAYNLPLHEQVLVHTYQAINYLSEKNNEAAMVEIRQAHIVQSQLLQQQNLDLSARVLSDEQNFGIDWHSVNQAYPKMDDVIGSKLNGVQNGFMLVLSALMYESAGQIDDALIDLKAALVLYPNNPYLRTEVERLSARQAGGKASYNSNTHGRLVILYEQDLITPKEELMLRLPIYTSSGDMRFYSVALPTYQYITPTRPLSVQFNDKMLQGSEIAKFNAQAAANLKDNISLLITRQLGRLIAKEQVRRTMAKEGGDVGNVIAALYNLASERADTRSWLSLPNNAQIVSSIEPIGTANLALLIDGHQHPVSIEIKPNSTLLLLVKSNGQMVQNNIYYL
ncbi:hypothetical protein ORJ66_15375 [Pseudoalteromonas tunicata]|uniref:COG3014 family protein n=1 Tax=Pseudoalteromonas tunicata TaxID=314281 RepID=UPI00273E0A95|nr:hypothetical protein [Pseudoalteromonas tunicata]MDP5214436.1 hypothetical protein [Pseudoalteromonas tunicata]